MGRAFDFSAALLKLGFGVGGDHDLKHALNGVFEEFVLAEPDRKSCGISKTSRKSHFYSGEQWEEQMTLATSLLHSVLLDPARQMSCCTYEKAREDQVEEQAAEAETASGDTFFGNFFGR